jgi:type IV secretion system protein VirB9
MTCLACLRPLAPLFVVSLIASPSPAHTLAGASPAETVRAANRASTIEPKDGHFINAAAVYPFRDNAVYRAYTAPGRVTDVALQGGETLVAVASGDTVRWIIGDTSSGPDNKRRVHVLVKPVAADLSTNLVITTDRRTYHLALTSAAGPAMAVLSWSYPRDELLALERSHDATAAATAVAAGLDLAALNFAYAITGDRPAWRPLRAFDDGRRTYIEFPASLAVGEAPPLFLIDGKGEASLVNYRVQGRFYIVDRLFAAAELRLGAKQQTTVRIVRTRDNGATAGRRRTS